MKTILIPFDFSEQATNALHYGIEIAKRVDGQLYILNVKEFPEVNREISYHVGLLHDVNTESLKEAEKDFQRLLDKIMPEGVSWKSKTRFGDISDNILEFIGQFNIDMVVMGTAGDNKLHSKVWGSNTEKVVRHSPVPVIALKSDMSSGEVKNIVFPHALNSDSNEDLLLKVKALQHLFNARLHVVRINTPLNFKKDITSWRELEQFASRYMLKDFTLNIFNDVDEEAGILNFSQRVKADLIAIGTHGRKGLARFMEGSLAGELVNHAHIPVWTYTIKKYHEEKKPVV